MRVLSLFDGIACGRIALERAGIEIESYRASEIDKYAMKVAKERWPDIVHIGDVRNVREEECDLLIGGSPCQDLSLAGKGLGLDGDRSGLFYEYVRILRESKPTWFLLENVVPRKVEWKKEIDEIMGVEGVAINSNLFVPQNRPRIYWTNIPIGKLPEKPEWNDVWYQWRRTYWRQAKGGVCPCLTANMGTGGHNVPCHSMDLTDVATVEELEALQGLPTGYTQGISRSRRLNAIGNGWTVDVVTWLLAGLK